jgi:hypothetical protein
MSITDILLRMLKKLYLLKYSNMTGSVRITYLSGAFVQPLLQWKSNEYYTTCE